MADLLRLLRTAGQGDMKKSIQNLYSHISATVALSLSLTPSPLDNTAEAELHKHLNENFAGLVQALAQVVADESQDLQTRQLATLYVKNTLNAKSSTLQQNYHERWKHQDQQFRNTVKQAFLTALRSSTEQVPHFVAVATAEIAAVELPYKEWHEFLPTLTENVNHAPKEHIKIATLECLGYTCERIYDVSILVPGLAPELEPDTVDKMLTSIVDSIQPSRSSKMRFAGLTALKNSLFFVQKNMDVKAERDMILKAITDCTSAQEAQLRALAFSCLDLIAEQYYDTLQDYMTHIYNLTTEAIKNPSEDEEVKIAAIEFWNTLGQVEQQYLDEEEDCREMGVPLNREPSPKYIAAAMEPLTPLLLEQLTKQDEHAEPEDYDLSTAAAVCLQTISFTVGGGIIPVVMPFVERNIQASDWHLRDAALVSFSGILEGPTTEQIGNYIVQACPVIIQLFHDNTSLIVRESAVFCIDAIARLHMPALAMDANVFGNVVDNLISKLAEEPRVAKLAASAIFNIAHSLKPSGKQEQDSNLLSNKMYPLLENLLKAADRPDADDLRVTVMSSVSELIAAAATDVQSTLVQLLPTIVARFEGAVNIRPLSSDENEKKELLLGSLSGVIQSLMLRMSAQEVGGEVDRIMALMLEGLKLRNSACDEEIFLAIGSVAGVVEGQFAKYMPQFMPFLIQGLQNFTAQSLCSVCIGVIVDICIAVGNQIIPYCDQIMKTLIECLKDSSVNRDVKPQVISCFGDIAMAIGGAFEPYLQPCVMLLMQASQQQAGDDEEMIEFINTLRTSILEAYSGIISGLEDGNILDRMLPLLQGIFQFLNFLASDANRDDQVLNKAVGLLGDIARSLGVQPTVKGELRQQFVVVLVNAAAQSGEEETRETAAWAGNVIQQVVNS